MKQWLVILANRYAAKQAKPSLSKVAQTLPDDSVVILAQSVAHKRVDVFTAQGKAIFRATPKQMRPSALQKALDYAQKLKFGQPASRQGK